MIDRDTTYRMIIYDPENNDNYLFCTGQYKFPDGKFGLMFCPPDDPRAIYGGKKFYNKEIIYERWNEYKKSFPEECEGWECKAVSYEI